jgi:hypothetical protein
MACVAGHFRVRWNPGPGPPIRSGAKTCFSGHARPGCSRPTGWRRCRLTAGYRVVQGHGIARVSGSRFGGPAAYHPPRSAAARMVGPLCPPCSRPIPLMVHPADQARDAHCPWSDTQSSSGRAGQPGPGHSGRPVLDRRRAIQPSMAPNRPHGRGAGSGDQEADRVGLAAPDGIGVRPVTPVGDLVTLRLRPAGGAHQACHPGGWLRRLLGSLGAGCAASCPRARCRLC